MQRVWDHETYRWRKAKSRNPVAKESTWKQVLNKHTGKAEKFTAHTRVAKTTANVNRLCPVLSQISSENDPPINHQRLPSHIVTIRAAQKAHRLRHVLRHARPAQRNQVLAVLPHTLPLRPPVHLPQLRVNLVPHRRAHDARRVRIHRDPVRRHLHRKRLRQPAHRPLRGAVVREQREGLEGDDGGSADEFATGALRDHLLGRGLVAVEDAVEVDVEHAVDILGGELEERLYLRDAGVGDHGVEGPEGGDRFLDQGFHFGGGGDVGDDANGFAAEGLDFFNRLWYGWISRDRERREGAKGSTDSMPAWLAAISLMQRS